MVTSVTNTQAAIIFDGIRSQEPNFSRPSAPNPSHPYNNLTFFTLGNADLLRRQSLTNTSKTFPATRSRCLSEPHQSLLQPGHGRHHSFAVP